MNGHKSNLDYTVVVEYAICVVVDQLLHTLVVVSTVVDPEPIVVVVESECVRILVVC